MPYTRIYIAGKPGGEDEMRVKEAACRKVAGHFVSMVHKDVDARDQGDELSYGLRQAIKLLQPGDELLAFSWADFGRSARRMVKLAAAVEGHGATYRTAI
ncbi:hypothetical protein AB0M54_45880 [Actinoplanes sp. NPDC051470]|uniref:hypothetical protein n=1 Tax=Actinoplanes sp. NPDC051470 TaxID=3157224 RepID=UPI00343D0000